MKLCFAAQSQFRLQNHFARDVCRCLRLNQIAEPSSDAGFELDDFAGFGGAKYFHISQRGEFQIFLRRDFGVALRDNPRELRRRLDKQHTGKNRFAGKVAAQKRFIAANLVFAFGALARCQIYQPVNEPEFPTVRQKIQCVL